MIQCPSKCSAWYSWSRSRGSSTRNVERRIGRIRESLLARYGALRVNVQVTAVLAAPDVGIEGVVLLLVHERVGLRVGAEDVPPYAQAEQRLRILLDVEHGTAVRRPDDRRLHVRDHVRQQRPGLEVLEAQRVLPAPDGVVRECEQPVVGADLEVAQLVEVQAARELDDVEHHLLGSAGHVATPGVQRILLARLETPVVPVAALAVRNAGVVLLDPADDLLVQLLLQRREVRQHRILVVVLGLQVCEHVLAGALIVTQPVVLVDARAVRRAHVERASVSDGRLQTAAVPTRTG